VHFIPVNGCACVHIHSVHAAQALKKVMSSTKSGVVRARVDFSQIFQKSTNVTITVWHNAGDDCGPACYYLHEFIEEMADVARLLVPGACYMHATHAVIDGAKPDGLHMPLCATCLSYCALVYVTQDTPMERHPNNALKISKLQMCTMHCKQHCAVLSFVVRKIKSIKGSRNKNLLCRTLVHGQCQLLSKAEMCIVSAGHPISIVPRFTYDTCSPAESMLCEMSCTNKGRYCHKKIENTHLWGRVVAAENIRQACLYDVLRKQGNGDTRAFWEYKKWFQAKCDNEKRTFNHHCSIAVRCCMLWCPCMHACMHNTCTLFGDNRCSFWVSLLSICVLLNWALKRNK
jgi:hypothetical protein